jgi:SAM-dependent methyltransferase
MINAALMFRQATKIIARQIPAVSRLVKQRDELLIEVGRLRDQLGRESATFEFGGFRRLSPVTNNWGLARGQPVDRAYIEQFLSQHRGDIRGDVLEIGDNHYTLRFGEERVRKSVIADVSTANANATIVADLVDAPQIPDRAFDCVILIKVLERIFDVEAALRTVSRILKPGGVALIAVPSISQTGADATDPAALIWSFYPQTLRYLLSRYFNPQKLTVESYGNVKTAISFLAGLAQEDLAQDDLKHNDPRYPLIVVARAIKPGLPPRVEAVRRLDGRPEVSVLMPVFNAAPYIAEAVESVRAQTLDKWELIIVDDGSVDESYAIARRYAEREPDRIRVFQHPDHANHGLSRTLNHAIAQASASCIAFLDADDTWMPERLAYDLGVLDANPSISAVISSTLYWWMDESEPARVDRFNSPLNCVWLPRSFFRSAWLRQESDIPCITAFTARTDVLSELGGFDESYSVAQDMKVIAEVAFRYSVFVADACNTEYRRTGASLWSRSIADGRDAECRRQFRKWMKVLIERHAAADPALLTLFNANLPLIAPLIGCEIRARRATAAAPDGADDDGLDITVGPSHAIWTASMRLEAGQFLVKFLGAHVDRPLAIEVSIREGGVTLASARVALTPIFDPSRELCVPFKVGHPVSDISITLANEGNGTMALRAIEVRAEGWSSELPLLLT